MITLRGKSHSFKSYRENISGLRICSVDGMAFIDNCASLLPFANGSSNIDIVDANGYILNGYLKAAGSSETLGSELIPDPAFDTDASWTKDGGWTIDAGYAKSNAAGAGGLVGTTTDVTGTDLGKLLKFVLVCSSYTSGTFAVRISSEITGTTRSSADTFTDYITKPSTTNRAVGVRAVSTLYAWMSSISMKQVTAPSSNGITVVSASGGTTYNFTSKNGSFVYNQASYDVIVRR